jgi:transposase InsO family protein
VYKNDKALEKKLENQEAVRKLVERERKQLPRIGTRKLYHLIKNDLHEQGLKFGRDKLFNLIRLYGLEIKPRRRYVQTTMSKHWLRKWPNLIRDKQVNQRNEVWVSDITYIKTEEENCYLNMVTDMHSRRIMGYAVDDNMETDSMIEALKMAINERNDTFMETIHHSDRGLQYCSKEYVAMSLKNNIKLSMTENGDPYENALAERMNRTIKEEFGLDRKLKNKEQVKKLVEESIFLYNQKRPHLALEMKTPEQVYNEIIPAT